jgi:cytoskeletal protein RodZ
MQTLGDYLKKEREARDISLSEVSDFTKISIIYLDCLEKDEFAKIPGEAYVKGYISSYAECLGISEHEALKLYDSSHVASDNIEEAEPEIAKANPPPLLSTKTIGFGLALGILIVLAISAYFTFFKTEKNVTDIKTQKDVADFKAQNNVADDKTLAQSKKSSQPTLTSEIEPDVTTGGQAGNSLQSMQKDESVEQFENKEVAKQDDHDPIHRPAPQENLHPEQNSTDVVPESASGEFAGLDAVSGAENDQARLENNEKVVEASAFENDQARLENNEKVVEAAASENDQTRLKNNLKIVEATACSAIENRLPQGIGDSFEWSTDRIYIWTRIECENPPSSIRHIYYFNGQKVSDILLNIRSSHWRTWSYKTISSKRYVGPWRVDLTTVDGKLLQSIHFEIK